MRKRLRVTTGCKTCRTRRVKCDETRPVCRNCARKDRSCRYEVAGRDRPTVRTRRSGLSVVQRNDDLTDHNEGLDANHNLECLVSQSPNLASILPTEQPLPSINLQHINHLNTASSDIGHENSHEFIVPHQIQLSAEEITIFRNYVERVSGWIDSFSRDRPFYSRVPIMALRCPVLMNSCLALSAKQLALKASGDEGRTRENIAVHYHQKAIKALNVLLTNPNYTGNDEILACSIILSTYEMLDVAGENFGSHLNGVAFFLQSRQVHGDECGLKGAAYWTWYRHEIWAALQTGRRMSLDEKYWTPEPLDSYEGMPVHDIANRVIFIFGQCVSFCNDGNAVVDNGAGEVQSRQGTATALETALEDWKNKLPASMSHFFAELSQSPEDVSHQFPFLWFIYPQSAIAYQVYHASKILLNLHRPAIPSESFTLQNTQSLSTRRQIERSRQQIFLVSNAGVPDTWSLVSSQCLYIAGLVTEGVLERRRTLELIEDCQRSSGRRTVVLADELRRLWAVE